MTYSISPPILQPAYTVVLQNVPSHSFPLQYQRLDGHHPEPIDWYLVVLLMTLDLEEDLLLHCEHATGFGDFGLLLLQVEHSPDRTFLLQARHEHRSVFEHASGEGTGEGISLSVEAPRNAIDVPTMFEPGAFTLPVDSPERRLKCPLLADRHTFRSGLHSSRLHFTHSLFAKSRATCLSLPVLHDQHRHAPTPLVRSISRAQAKSHVVIVVLVEVDALWRGVTPAV